MIDPKKAQRLMKTSAMKEFVPILLEEMKEEFNTIEDIDTTEDEKKIALEVKARKLAFGKLGKILSPLLNTSAEVGKFNKEEFIA